MTRKQYGIIWAGLGFSTVYTALNFYMITQGGDLAFPAPISIDTTRYSAAVYGLVIIIPMFFGFLYLTIATLDQTASSWAAKVPLPFENANRDDGVYRVIATVAVLVFLAVPMISIVHFENKMLKGMVVLSTANQQKLAATGISFDSDICINSPEISGRFGCVIADSAESHLFNFAVLSPLFSRNFTNRFHYDPHPCAATGGDCKGITFFPTIQPWLFVLLGVAVFAYWCRTIYLIVRNSRARK